MRPGTWPATCGRSGRWDGAAGVRDSAAGSRPGGGPGGDGTGPNNPTSGPDHAFRAATESKAAQNGQSGAGNPVIGLCHITKQIGGSRAGAVMPTLMLRETAVDPPSQAVPLACGLWLSGRGCR